MTEVGVEETAAGGMVGKIEDRRSGGRLILLQWESAWVMKSLRGSTCQWSLLRSVDEVEQRERSPQIQQAKGEGVEQRGSAESLTEEQPHVVEGAECSIEEK
mmetsp:Transcript_24726/g.62169  ORF Transcript_24726/g.62169 Transcript_24726/m.62169 type:complete len:102 (+) Transcript_24726:8206-8511(+)